MIMRSLGHRVAVALLVPACLGTAAARADTVRFTTDNIFVEGDVEAVDRLRFGVQSVQDTLDAIAAQVNDGRYDLARRNIENLRESLASLGGEATSVGPEFRFVVSFAGAPTDAAMDRIRDLERERDDNHRLWQHALQKAQVLNDALLQNNLRFLSTVWKGMCESMMSWHSPPPWYRVPDTLLAWQAEAEQHAAEIQDDQAMVDLYRMMLAAFEGIRDRALRDHERLLERLEEMAPVRELHAELTALLGDLGWAQAGAPQNPPDADAAPDPPDADAPPDVPDANTTPPPTPGTCRTVDLEVRMGPAANDWPEAAAWVSGLGAGWRMATIAELEALTVACPPPLPVCQIWAGGDPADHVAVWSQTYPADTDPAALACIIVLPDKTQTWCRRYDGFVHWNTRAFAVRCR